MTVRPVTMATYHRHSGNHANQSPPDSHSYYEYDDYEEGAEYVDEVFEPPSEYGSRGASRPKRPRDRIGTRAGGMKMVPPSRPEVTKLSDASVMLEWSVPNNDGLQITFFKVEI